jgi:hypothetical protein
MAYDQFGRIVPDGTPGATPAPPTGAPPIGVGTYYSGDPSNPITQNPNAGFGSRSLAPGTTDQYVLNPNAVNGAPLSTAYAPPGVSAPNPAGSPVDPTFAGSGGAPNALGLNPNSYGAAFNDPGMVTTAYNMNNGIAPNSGTYALNSNYGKNLDVLYGILNGRDIMGASPEDYYNFANNYIQQGATPGGTHISTQDVMAALFSNDPQNPIYQTIYGLDQNGNAPTPDTIVNRFIGVMQQGMANEAPPMVINAMTSMYAQAGDEWKVLVAQGKLPPNMTFTDYLQQKGLGPQLVGG